MLPLVPALLLVACTSPTATGEDSAGDANFVGGGAITFTAGDLQPSYVEATWSAPGAARTRLEVADEAGPVLVTDWQASASATAVPLLGLWVGGTFTVSLVDDTGAVYAREPLVTEAGASALSGLTVTGTPGWSGYLYTSLVVANAPVAVILAPNGRVVWYEEVPGTPISRVLPRADGAGVWVMTIARQPPQEPGRLVSYAWDGSVLVDFLPAGHMGEGPSHDFIVTDDDHLWFLGFDTRDVEGVGYRGDAVYEVAVDGTGEEERWSVWDDFTPGADVPDPMEWTHANALRPSPATGTVFVGLRSLDTLVELDPTTWRPVHQLGGASPDVAFLPTGSAFSGQHGFELRGDDLVMHDNRSSEQGTRMVSYHLDRAALTATQQWEYEPEPALYDYVLGDANWVDDDSILANWSTSGLLEEVDLPGDTPWALTLDLGMVFGYSELVDTLPGTTQAPRP